MKYNNIAFSIVSGLLSAFGITNLIAASLGINYVSIASLAIFTAVSAMLCFYYSKTGKLLLKKAPAFSKNGLRAALAFFTLLSFALVVSLPVPVYSTFLFVRLLLITGWILLFTSVIAAFTLLIYNLTGIQQQTSCSPGLKSFFTYFTPPFIVFLVYLLAYYPGVMTYDSFNQWEQMETMRLNDWHPVFHTLVSWAITSVWHSPAAISLSQIILLSLVFAAAMMQFERMGVKRIILIAVTAFFALNPVNGILSVTIWKDVPFSASLLWLTVLVVKIYHSRGSWLTSYKNRAILIISLLFTALLRHNGVVPAIITMLAILPFYARYWRKVLSVLLAALALIYLIKGPVYEALDVQPINAYQPLVSPLLQIGAVIHYGGMVTSSEKDFLNKVIPWEDWKTGYRKYNSLGLTGSKGYNGKYLSEHKFEFVAAWLKLAVRNPFIAIRAYTDRTNIIWRITSPKDLNLFTSPRYIVDNKYGIQMDSRLPRLQKALTFILNVSESKYFDWAFWRPALYMYLILIFAFVIFIRNGIKPLIAIIPAAANTMGLLLVTTSSQSRYYYSTLLAAVVIFLLSFYRQSASISHPNHDNENTISC